MKVTPDLSLLWYVIAYAVLMVILGIYFSKKVSKSEDYILAGRGLGTFVLAGTLLASWVGSGTVSGGETSMAYSFGLIPSLLVSVSSLIGIAVLYFILPKIRKTIGERKKYTLAAIMEEKYGQFARILTIIIVVLAYIGIVSYQFKGVGFILHLTTGLSVGWGTVIGAILIIFLAAVGGLRSVANTDFISAFIMIIGLLVALPTIYIIAGGWHNVIANTPPAHMGFTGSLSGLQLIGYLIPTLFLLMGDQNMYQRMAASKGDRTSKRAQWVWFIGILIVAPAISFIAFASASLFHHIQPGMALMATAVVMPQFVGGLLLASATAFIITTGDSFLLSSASNLTYDIMDRISKKKYSDRQLLYLTRVFVVVLGVLAFLLIRFFPTVLSVQMYAYTVYGAGITPAVLAIFLWKRANTAGGVSSMLVGVIVTLFWQVVLGNPFGLNSAVISIPAAIIVLIVVTLATSRKSFNSQKPIKM